jgi:dethiobiotin synthetase
VLIEGTGGVLVPVGEGLSMLDLFPNHGCQAILISGNRLGTPNRAIPTVDALQHAGIKKLKVVLRPSAERDSPADSDGLTLSEMPDPTPLIPTPFQGKNPTRLEALSISKEK